MGSADDPIRIIAGILAGLKHATPGTWERDTMDNPDGEYGSGPNTTRGFTTFQIVTEDGTICDALNSDMAVIEEEMVDLGESGIAYEAVDVVAAGNFDHIAACSPANMRIVLAYVRDLIAGLRAHHAWHQEKGVEIKRGDNFVELCELYVESMLEERTAALLSGAQFIEWEEIVETGGGSS